jgi:hypothetical protein
MPRSKPPWVTRTWWTWRPGRGARGVGDLGGRPVGGDDPAVADLAARHRVEGRAVEDDEPLLAGVEAEGEGAVLQDGEDAGVLHGERV